MMKLRPWQEECVLTAVEHFKHTSKHFLCLATPGAGKTIMAAELAASLHGSKLVDFILCFSPSINVANSIRDRFSQRLNCRFDGVIGALGCSYTYQSLLFFNDDFWQIMNNHRVLVIFDEIHHCSGSTIENANAWGEEIILKIQSQAAYTLALTGTPWRSDKAPIALSNYIEPDGAIQCDYVYGLREAVRDDVCRNPKIVLIDNEKLTVTQENKVSKVFSSFQALLDDPSVSYQAIITNDTAIRYALNLSCSKLREIRCMNPNAAGLIVASSVEHAEYIINILQIEFKQSAVLVTYKQPNAQYRIDQFRHSDTEWIVSVNMVSEGIDLPRLQVCCHLSHVKTELYFRQVLGRILRMNNAQNEDAWLYMFAEPLLSEFALRVQQEIPDVQVLVDIEIKNIPKFKVRNQEGLVRQDKESLVLGLGINCISELELQLVRSHKDGGGIADLTFEIRGDFREKVISTFSSPF
ncbi:diguanylate cyclase [Moritella marina ATCC 15381]|uniref:Diguanylate cyclase n=1 Tax=Moritella marina ATCC 15381 TaxID=1202962 RepID=A0A5J6WKS8_MORMI|nr:DEAD/DEAH box helicase family protein [Moritella marina]QFI37032.1 diguanylate cyclase [Moritella marina ATCC 15381]